MARTEPATQHAPWKRAAAVLVVCGIGAIIYATTVGGAYPIRLWLFWRLLEIWSWCALFNLGCVAFGMWVMTRWLRLGSLPPLELTVISMAVGLVAFTLGMYAAGVLALFRPPAMIALSCAMIAAGGPTLRAFAGGLLAARPTTADGPGWSSRITTNAVIAAGTICVALLYLQCLSPSALNYDSRWYHLAVAQDYARERRIVPFYADFNKSFPQLASLVHTWDWLVPAGFTTPLKCMLALHQEFMMVLWALAGVNAGAAFLLGRESGRVPGSWVGFFLFPIIFHYDSNIGGGADHVYGLFAIPILLATARALEDLSPRRCVLVGVLTAGAVLTRYQSVYLLVPVSVLIGGRWLWLALRGDRPKVWRGPVALLATGVAVSLPHFLKNLIFYRNPLYPFAMGIFANSHPRLADTPFLLRHLFSGDESIPRGPFLKDLGKAVTGAFATFSFDRPYVFGSMFTLLSPLLLLFRRRRLWVGAVVVWLGLLTWGMTYPVPRYLQGIMPIIAAVTVAIFIYAWGLGLLARIGLVALVGLQVIWSCDAPFTDGRDRLWNAIDLIRSGAEGNASTRLGNTLRAEIAISRRLPKEAVVLFHNTRQSLGLNRKVLQDLPGFQAYIDYRHIRTVRQLCQLYRSLGITHVVHERALWPAFSKQEEVLFATLVGRFAVSVFHEGPYEVFALPDELPPPEAPYRVLSLGMAGYADGVYPVEAMSTLEPLPDGVKRWASPERPVARDTHELSAIAGHVNAVLLPTSQPAAPELATVLGDQFDMVVSYSGNATFTVYVRRTAPTP